MPYDLPGVIYRFCNRIRPDLLIVMETEIWPNLFHTCQKYDVPVIIANARLSTRSLARYKKLLLLARQTVSKASFVFAQSKVDADRFSELGLERDKIHVTGNLKFDIPEIEGVVEQVGELKKILHTSGRKVWLAASTHDGEEPIILESHAGILAQIPGCLLVIAPRHPERFNMVVNLARKAGFSVLRMTDGQTVTSNIQVFILDTLGDLPACYTLSDIAFVGGSLVPAGGHNPLEAAARSVPVLFGSYTYNFSGICRKLMECGAAMTVKDAADLAESVLAFLSDDDKRRVAGESGRLFFDSNRGSVNAMLAELKPLLEKLSSVRQMDCQAL
jgi:3-deoxy-D-manno-octulosonic-acid transferase